MLPNVGNVADAEIEGVSLYELSIADVPNLAKAARVSPWIPRARKARKLERAMTFGVSSDNGTRRQRAVIFWERLGIALQDQHAPGSDQSNVRLAAYRARKRQLSWRANTREKALLTAFSVIGYGERIVLPLCIWLVGLLVAALVLYETDSARRSCGVAIERFCSSGCSTRWRTSGSLSRHGKSAPPRRPRRLGHDYLHTRRNSRRRLCSLLTSCNPTSSNAPGEELGRGEGGPDRKTEGTRPHRRR